uniref:Uncharacterized protein n=1 Tax=Physcomitrium patens TaxID=3218 RepID=A0A2K1L7Y6_PHYPA|nr:hypothetical protein PHYPA_000561 [Physcomitrium patens]
MLVTPYHQRRYIYYYHKSKKYIYYYHKSKGYIYYYQEYMDNLFTLAYFRYV